MLLLIVMAILFPEDGIGVGGDNRLAFLRLPDLYRSDTLSTEVDVEDPALNAIGGSRSNMSISQIAQYRADYRDGTN